jgi:hypothetical protein
LLFLDVAQAFDRYPGFLFKLKKILLSTLYLILKSYLEDRFLRVRHGGALLLRPYTTFMLPTWEPIPSLS